MHKVHAVKKINIKSTARREQQMKLPSRTRDESVIKVGAAALGAANVRKGK